MVSVPLSVRLGEDASSVTLPVRIYVYIDQNYDPLVTSVSSLLIFAAVISLFIIEKTVGMGRLFGLKQ